MNEQTKSDEKVDKLSSHFDEPHEVVEDPSLPKARKVEALDMLEQDARQLAEATSEGMSGGERNKLHEVLIAKKTLDLPQAVR
jgi:hypothetical protein